MQILSYIFSETENFISYFLQSCTFFGYENHPEDKIEKRKSMIESNGGKPLEGIDVESYYLPASAHKTHVIVYTHTSNFWQLKPTNYTCFKEHADVVLWNPKETTPRAYEEGLDSVVRKVRSIHPDKTVTIIGRCATVDPVIAAAAKLSDNKVNLVLDRGHGNYKQLARSITVLSLIPIVQNVISKYFDCQGANKIKEIPGKILFTRSKNDQLMSWGEQNLSDELIKNRGDKIGDQIIDLHTCDHWGRWTRDIHQKVYDFIGMNNVDTSAFPKVSSTPSFFSRHILPICIHAWF